MNENVSYFKPPWSNGLLHFYLIIKQTFKNLKKNGIMCNKILSIHQKQTKILERE